MVVIHVVVKKERQQVIKQEKKLTTNNIFLCDNKGQMIAMGSPKAGNHNDLYKIEEVLKEILALLEEAGIEHKGLFLNADAGFDSKSLREFLESKEIIANIKPNPRNGEQPDYYKHEKYITLHSITNCYPNLCARSAT